MLRRHGVPAEVYNFGTTPRAAYSGFGFGYFRLRGEPRAQMERHLLEVSALYDRLREPATPILANHSERDAPVVRPAFTIR